MSEPVTEPVDELVADDEVSQVELPLPGDVDHPQDPDGTDAS